MIRRRLSSPWPYALIGILLGLLYAGASLVLDSGVLESSAHHRMVTYMHEFVDTVLPVLLGLTAGLGFYYFRRQRLLNARLSSRNDRLKQDLLFHALISQILHEIQNPVHNLSAALEQDGSRLDAAQRDMLRRNLDKLKDLKSRYGRIGPLLESLDPEEPVRWDEWFETFYEDKLALQMRSSGINFTRELSPTDITMHPMLLEQVFQTLLSNCIETLESFTTPPPPLRLTSRPDRLSGRPVLRVRITNPGAYPAEVLAAQGRRPVQSKSGLGLGLLLTRTILEQVGGDLALSNHGSEAVTEVVLPSGER